MFFLGLAPRPRGFAVSPGVWPVPSPAGLSLRCPAGLSPQENYEDPHKTPASPVVHIRGLIDGIVEADLVEALQEFGPIRWGWRCGDTGDNGDSVLGTPGWRGGDILGTPRWHDGDTGVARWG